MQLERCSLGLCIVCFILTALAVILDDMALLYAATVPGAALLGQYTRFNLHARETVRSLEIRRTLGRNPVRRGMTLQVATRFTFTGRSGLHVTIEDLLPEKCILSDGKTSIINPPGAGSQTLKLSYRIIPVIHGMLQFDGVAVTVQDLFFKETFRLTREPDRGPVISVQPSGVFAIPPAESITGEGDSRKASIWASMDIHSLREYTPGDDLRHVDWKISAKYDKLFVRRYNGPLSHPPLIIVDLPWSGAPYPEKEYERMMSEVSGMVKHSIQMYQYVSVLVISGPNVIHLIREERNISKAVAELREWMHPAERSVHFYRMPERSELRSVIRGIEKVIDLSSDPAKQNFYDNLYERYTRTLQHLRAPAFSGQVLRTLAKLMMTEAHLFTLGAGDRSHIHHIVRPLRTHNIRVHVHVLEAISPDTHAARPYPAASAEVNT